MPNYTKKRHRTSRKKIIRGGGGAFSKSKIHQEDELKLAEQHQRRLAEQRERDRKIGVVYAPHDPHSWEKGLLMKSFYYKQDPTINAIIARYLNDDHDAPLAKYLNKDTASTTRTTSSIKKRRSERLRRSRTK